MYGWMDESSRYKDIVDGIQLFAYNYKTFTLHWEFQSLLDFGPKNGTGLRR
jgi:hypothetical protein